MLQQQQHVINTSTNPEGQNKVKMANESLKVQQPLLESSSEMDKLRCITNTAHSAVTKITVMETIVFSRDMSDREYQLTEPWSAKIVDKCRVRLMANKKKETYYDNPKRNKLKTCNM